MPETHTKRQATQHGCLSSLLGDGDKWTVIVYGEKKKICTEPTGAAKAEKNLLYRHDKPNEPAKEGLLSFLLFESYSPQFQQSAGATTLCIVSLVYARKKT